MAPERLFHGGMRLYEKLDALFASRNVSLDDVARACGVGKTTVHSWVHPRKRGSPRLGAGLRLARYLRVPLEYLADDDQDEPAPGLSGQEEVVLAFVRQLGVPEAIRRLAHPTTTPEAVNPDPSPIMPSRRILVAGQDRTADATPTPLSAPEPAPAPGPPSARRKLP